MSKPKCHTTVVSHHGHSVPGSCPMGHDSAASPIEAAFGQSAEEMADCCSGVHAQGHSGEYDAASQTSESQACLEHENCCIQHYNLKAKDYRGIVEAVVLEQMLLKYVKENKIGQDENTQDLIKYVSENVYIQGHSSIHGRESFSYSHSRNDIDRLRNSYFV